MNLYIRFITVSDDKVLDIKDYKKVNGEVTKITKKSKKSKKKKEDPIVEETIVDDFEYLEEDFDEDDYEDMLIEENELLQVELLKERTARQALEKLLNKYLKDSKKGKPNAKNNTDPDGSGKP